MTNFEDFSLFCWTKLIGILEIPGYNTLPRRLSVFVAFEITQRLVTPTLLGSLNGLLDRLGGLPVPSCCVDTERHLVWLVTGTTDLLAADPCNLQIRTLGSIKIGWGSPPTFNAWRIVVHGGWKSWQNIRESWIRCFSPLWRRILGPHPIFLGARVACSPRLSQTFLNVHHPVCRAILCMMLLLPFSLVESIGQIICESSCPEHIMEG